MKSIVFIFSLAIFTLIECKDKNLQRETLTTPKEA